MICIHCFDRVFSVKKFGSIGFDFACVSLVTDFFKLILFCVYGIIILNSFHASS